MSGLILALRHSIPGFVLFAATVSAVLTALMHARPASESIQAHRNALTFSFIGAIIAIATVHIWSATFVFFMFMLGAGAWISDMPRTGEEGAEHIDPSKTPETLQNGARFRPRPAVGARPAQAVFPQGWSETTSALGPGRNRSDGLRKSSPLK